MSAARRKPVGGKRVRRSRRSDARSDRRAGLPPASATAYLHLLKKTLIRVPLTDADFEMRPQVTGLGEDQLREIDRWIGVCRAGGNEELGDPETRTAGRDWPSTAESMIGLFRMDNLHACVLDVLQEGVPGDLMEVGVWRGGAVIFMRAVLDAFGVRDRRVWAADSFEGLPPPDAAVPADRGDEHWMFADLAVPLATVRNNLARYGLSEEGVIYVPGWFRDTLPSLNVERLAILRIDADMYDSTRIALRTLYPKVSERGYVILDDYSALQPCRLATDEFRQDMGIVDPLVTIDWTGAMWRVG
jgi:hypothetical protein